MSGVLRALTRQSQSCWPRERFLLFGNGAASLPNLYCLNSVKRRGMDTIDLKACLILERLRAEIPGAQIDYQRGGGMHRFAIAHGTLAYDVGFPERLLEVCGAEEIDRAIRIFVERVRTGVGPRRIKVGTRGGDRRAAA